MDELTAFLNTLDYQNPMYFWIGGLLMLFLIFLPLIRNRRGLAVDIKYWKPLKSIKSKRYVKMSIPVVIATVLLAGTLVNPEVTTVSSSLIIGKPVMMVIDISGSTVAASKLHPKMTSQEAARNAFESLISLRSDISFGLMLYSTQNFIARYFTYKNELFQDTLENEYAIYRLNRETNTSSALEAAREFLTENITGEDKAIILISDLMFTTEDILKTYDEIYNIIDADIDLYIVSTTGDETYMLSLPRAEGVTILDIYNTESVNKMYDALTAMNASPITLEETYTTKSFIPYVVPPLLGLGFLCIILSETRYRKIP